ncbi:MAG: DinB family protein [Sphingomonadales bacterium]
MVENLRMLVRFKRWANKRTFSVVMDLPPNEALKDRPTYFKNIVHTLNHIYVIDAIFRAHLEDRKHGYTARNTDTHPPLEELWQLVQAMDDWYVNYCDRLTAQTLEEVVHFRFVDGGGKER